MKHTLSISGFFSSLKPAFVLTLGIGLLAGNLNCVSSSIQESTERTAGPPTLPSRSSLKYSSSQTSELTPEEKRTEQRLAQMSKEEKLGQLLILGFPGTTLTPQLKKHLSTVKPGGVILFSRNIKSFKQLRKLNDDLQAHAQAEKRPPYLVMIDQEGGSVTRVKIGSPLPSALALSKTNNPEFVRIYSQTMAELLNRLGINMNLAPVLDVSDPRSDSFIGSRSFGKSNESVALLGEAFAKGQWDAGIIPTAKHFPGHGGLNQDSHKVTPVKSLTLPELLNGEALPFATFAKLNFPTAIMLGHVSYPAIDGTRFPAAFSKEIGENLLRGNLRYQGLAITDDLEMAGAEMVGNMSARTIQAVVAGNDMIMVAWSGDRQQKAYNALSEALNSGKFSEDRLNESVRRILFSKYLVHPKRMEYSEKEIEKLKARLAQQSKEVKKLSFQSALGERITLDDLSEDPIQVVSSDTLFYKKFRSKLRMPSRHLHVTKTNISDVISGLNRKVPRNPFIFYVSGMGTARWIQRLSPQAKLKAIIINTNQPGAIKTEEPFLKVVNINSLSPESGEWLAQYLNPHLRTPAKIN